ncbi:alpha-N-acetylglucosaminidase [Streptomyces sp. NPDC050439]|uniref:alpha-N-acetylglucosaminidase n=1 Tax=unclassified Streptomyces TaxID=2593676 RepID=UPI00342BB3F2
MPLARRTFLTALAGTTGAAVACSGSTADGAPPSAPPALKAARRLLPGHHKQLTFVTEGPADTFRVAGRDGRITVTGSNPAVQLKALHHYLKHKTHANITWAGSQLSLPDRLPGLDKPMTGSANTPHRFVLNDTNDGYTGAYHDWSYWEREIDVLALHGYNEVLVYVGADALYHRVFQEFGYSDKELREWIPAPAHQPWWLLQNMSSFPHPVSSQLLTRRATLGRRIADRLRELGMTPVFPGYFGTVPPGFTAKNPGARTVPQGDWVGFTRPDWLDPRTEHFTRVAAAFYRAQDDLFGSSTMYKMDLLHEGGKPGDVPVPDAAKAVEKALQSAHPGATWVILGWQSNPPKAIVDAVDKSRMLVVDGLSDRFSKITDRESDWNDTPYTFGSIWNFGGHTTLGANTPDWAALYEKWRTKKNSALRGISLMPEAADNNPAAFELFSELPWRTGSLDLPTWFADWSVSRYGAADPHAAAAWDTLRRTAYGTTRADQWAEGADGLFGARPALDAKSAAAWSPKTMRYTPSDFEPALTQLLAVRRTLRNSSAYRQDLLDVARQALSNRSRVLLPQIKQAYDKRNEPLFDQLTRTWLDLMTLLDKLTSTDSRHLLGRWVADARSWGADATEKEHLAYDQLSLLTVWGTRSGADAGLRDYANREWAGLVGGLYHLRWETYFKELRTALTENRPPKTIDWFAIEDGWIRNPGRLATRPTGNTYKVAVQVQARLTQTN